MGAARWMEVLFIFAVTIAFTDSLQEIENQDHLEKSIIEELSKHYSSHCKMELATNSVYYLKNIVGTWDDANSLCNRANLSLVSFNSTDEINLFLSQSNVTGAFWVLANDRYSDLDSNEYKWGINGPILTNMSTMWFQGNEKWKKQPNEDNPGFKTYCIFAFDGGLHDEFCYQKYRIACECERSWL